MQISPSESGTTIIAGKLLLGFGCTIAGVILATNRRLLALPQRWFRVWVLAVWIVTRVGLFFAVFLALRMEPTSDVTEYVLEGRLAMRGLWVYRDFITCYAPLFPYALAVALKYIWASSKMVVVLAMLAELASLPFWMEAFRKLLSPMAARQATMLYLASASPLVNVALNGQNQVWVSLFVGIALWLYTRDWAAAAGFVLSVPFILVKFLPLLTVPAFVSRRSAPFRLMASFAVAPTIVYGFLILHHIDVLVPVWYFRVDRTGGNVPFLLSAALLPLRWEVPVQVIDGVALLILAALALWIVRQQPAVPALAALWALNLLILTLLLANRKSYPSYLVMSFFPLCAIVAHEGITRLRVVLFGVFGFVAMIEPTLWWRWLNGQNFLALGPSVGAGLVPWKVTLFFFTDLVLLGFYIVYWRSSWRAFRAASGALLTCLPKTEPLT